MNTDVEERGINYICRFSFAQMARRPPGIIIIVLNDSLPQSCLKQSLTTVLACHNSYHALIPWPNVLFRLLLAHFSS